MLIDSYPETNWSTAMNIRRVHPTAEARASAAGQSFQTTLLGNKDYKLTSCIFNLRKSGLPVGIMNAQLFAHSGVFGASSLPTGVALATSDDLAMESLTNLYVNYTLTFSGAQRYLLRASIGYYCIALIMTSATLLDDSNYVIFGTDDTAPTHPGNYFYWVSSAWTVNAAWDGLFYVYGNIYPKTGGLANKLRLLNII